MGCVTFIVKGREQRVTNVVFVCFSFDFKESPASCMWENQNVSKPYSSPFLGNLLSKVFFGEDWVELPKTNFSRVSLFRAGQKYF